MFQEASSEQVRAWNGLTDHSDLPFSADYSESVPVAEAKTDIVHYKASIKCWPRVYKSQQLIRGMIDRCSVIENKLGMQVKQEDTYSHYTAIDIYISNSAKLGVDDLILRRECIEEIESLFLKVHESNTSKDSDSLRKSFCGIYLDERGVSLIKEISSTEIRVVLLANGIMSEPSQSTDPKLEISSLLEQVVFEKLIEKYNFVKNLYENSDSAIEGVILKPGNGERRRTKKSGPIDLRKEHIQTIEQLFWEMTSLLKRSKLPRNKLPVMTEYKRKQVSKQVAEKLFELDDTIWGCGYSNNTFNINVERLSDENENLIREERIQNFLEQFRISDFKFNIVSKSVSEYKSIGAEIRAETYKAGKFKRGTLGGFASLTKEKNTSSCALFSKHVACGCKDKLYINDGGQITEFGVIVRETLEGGSYDIAAAKIHDEHVAQCDTQFKNSDNVKLPGKLYTSVNDIDLQNLPVHIWGASSRPGLGIIRIPELIFRNAPEIVYMQLEDREDAESVKQMAVPGDSGAIVCADDLDNENVHVISMLMGSLSENNSSAKGPYIAFPLVKGVEYLDRKAGGTFSIKGITSV